MSFSSLMFYYILRMIKNSHAQFNLEIIENKKSWTKKKEPITSKTNQVQSPIGQKKKNIRARIATAMLCVILLHLRFVRTTKVFRSGSDQPATPVEFTWHIDTRKMRRRQEKVRVCECYSFFKKRKKSTLLKHYTPFFIRGFGRTDVYL